MNQTWKSMPKVMAKGRKPRIVTSNSSKVFGTSSETTSSVTAKAMTASLRASMRETSPSPRSRKPFCTSASLFINVSRIIVAPCGFGGPQAF